MTISEVLDKGIFASKSSYACRGCGNLYSDLGFFGRGWNECPQCYQQRLQANIGSYRCVNVDLHGEQ